MANVKDVTRESWILSTFSTMNIVRTDSDICYWVMG